MNADILDAEDVITWGDCMNKQGEIFLNTCIEYLKKTDATQESKEIQILLRRSTVDFIKTIQYVHNGKVWNQRQENIILRVPIPLFDRAKELKIEIAQLFREVYAESQEYAFGALSLGPKYLEDDDINYKEHNVVFDSIEKTIIEAIRDAKYVIWIAVAWFTNRRIYDELILKKNEGVNIRILTIGNNSNKYLLPELKENFDTIGIVLPGSHVFHDKFCIIDLEYVMHGSYNWSDNANGNEETSSTALDRDFTKKFADKFMSIYKSKKVNEEDCILCVNK